MSQTTDFEGVDKLSVAIEQNSHRMDCTFYWSTPEECKLKGYACTCEREAEIQRRREAGDPVWT